MSDNNSWAIVSVNEASRNPESEGRFPGFFYSYLAVRLSGFAALAMLAIFASSCFDP